MKPTSCPPRVVIVDAACDAQQTAGSMEDDCSAADSSTAASDGDSIAITSNTVFLRAGDGNALEQEREGSGMHGRVGRLCFDEVVLAFSYLTAAELLIVGSACRSFRMALQLADYYLWSPHCRRLWSGKQRFSRVVDEFESKRLEMAAEESLEIVHACRKPRVCLPVSLGAFISPFERSCLSVLREYGMITAPSESLKLDILSPTAELWWNLPPEEKISVLRQHSKDDDKNNSRSWKLAFFMSLRDAKRQALTKHELTSATWRISFKQAAARPELGKLTDVAMQFSANGTLDTAVHGPLSFQLCQGGTILQVGSLPPLTVRRGGDDEAWKWMIENFFVRIESVDIPMPTYLKHLQQHTSMRPP